LAAKKKRRPKRSAAKNIKSKERPTASLVPNFASTKNRRTEMFAYFIF
jgi:hypothetical protein